MPIASSPALRPPGSRPLRESPAAAVASSACPWRLVVVVGTLVRREDEPARQEQLEFLWNQCHDVHPSL